MEERRIFTLSQVSTAIQHKIAEATGGQAYWIKAEIAQFKVKNHAYLELVEHKEGQKVAVMRANIWNSNYQRIRQELGREAGNILKDGVEVLLLGRVQYHLVYGLSINIEAIDLSFNIGELERRKLATIKTLKEEGLYNRNRFTPMPMVLQRIALVASAARPRMPTSCSTLNRMNRATASTCACSTRPCKATRRRRSCGRRCRPSTRANSMPWC